MNIIIMLSINNFVTHNSVDGIVVFGVVLGGSVNISGRGPKYNCTREILTTGCAVLFLGNLSLTLLVPTSRI
jgi:hypothetical protein